MCLKFCKHPKSDREDARWEKKILSRVINQNAPLENKIQLVYFCLIDMCMLIILQRKGMGKIAFVAEKKSHLPVLLMSIPLKTPQNTPKNPNPQTFKVI